MPIFQAGVSKNLSLKIEDIRVFDTVGQKPPQNNHCGMTANEPIAADGCLDTKGLVGGESLEGIDGDLIAPTIR